MSENIRHFYRADDGVWEKAVARAKSEGTNMSERLRTWTELYAENDAALSLEAELARAVAALNDVVKRMGRENTRVDRSA